MVRSAGAPAPADRARRLKAPRPIEVPSLAARGEPGTICETAMRRRGWQARGMTAAERRCRRVERVQDEWRVDTEWWRPRQVTRHYYQLLLVDGLPETVYRDLVDGLWYAQLTGEPA